MSVFMEYKKVKRTGFLPTFLGGGILAAAFPVINMAVRPEIYLTQQGSPLQILFNANWQIIAMLNILLIMTEACILYNTEYASNAENKVTSNQGKFCFLKQSNPGNLYGLSYTYNRSSGSHFLFLLLV